MHKRFFKKTVMGIVGGQFGQIFEVKENKVGSEL